MKHEIEITDEMVKRFRDVYWCAIEESERRLDHWSIRLALEAALRPSPKRRFTDSPREERRKTEHQKNMDQIDTELDEVDRLLKGAPYGAEEPQPTEERRRRYERRQWVQGDWICCRPGCGKSFAGPKRRKDDPK